jgi:hypothetical protein
LRRRGLIGPGWLADPAARPPEASARRSKAADPKSEKDQETISFRSSANASFSLGFELRGWKNQSRPERDL